MTIILKMKRFFSGEPLDQASQGDYLDEQIEITRKSLEGAYHRFNYASESDALESCIYEIKSLEHRYGYLLKTKKQELKTGPLNIAKG